MEFEKNGLSIILDKKNNESFKVFTERGYFIINQNKNNLYKNFDNIDKLSKVWINKKFKKCKYNYHTEKLIKNLNNYNKDLSKV